MPAKQADPATQALGAKVRRLRDLRNWTQADLAAALGEQLGRKVDQTLVTRLEQGRRTTSVEDLAALARIFSVPMAALDDRLDPFGDDPDYEAFVIAETRAGLQAARDALVKAARDYGAAAARVVNCGDEEPDGAASIVADPETEGWNQEMDSVNG